MFKVNSLSFVFKFFFHNNFCLFGLNLIIHIDNQVVV